MKDFLGNTINIGDRVVSFSNYSGCSSHFFEATVAGLSERQVKLNNINGGKVPVKELAWTVPHKIIVIKRGCENAKIN